MVASDRVSVYDVVLPTPIPDKGAILTQLSLWWFGQVAGNGICRITILAAASLRPLASLALEAYLVASVICAA